MKKIYLITKEHFLEDHHQPIEAYSSIRIAKARKKELDEKDQASEYLIVELPIDIKTRWLTIKNS